MAHRIDTPRHVLGLFDPGNPSLGLRPTALDAVWCNMVQEEIVNTVEDADGGNITLVKGTNTQLKAAIQAMIDRAIGPLLPHITLIGEGKWLEFSGAYNATLYKPAHGQTFNRADYPGLWAIVSTSPNLAADGTDKANNPTKWGRGNGTTTFEMPDYRGVFLRVDADGKAGTMAPARGVFKANQNKAHTHAVDQHSGTGGTYGSEPFEENGAGGGMATGSQGGNEAVPDHTTILYVIRVL